MDMGKVLGAVARMGPDELRQVADIISLRRQQLELGAMMRLEVGMRVAFRDGDVMREGTVTKLGRKTVSVRERRGEGGVNWRVSPSLLSRVVAEVVVRLPPEGGT